MLKVRLVRSKIGCTPYQRKVLEALGLTRIRQVRELPDSSATLGMIKKVSHMVEVEK